METIVQSAQQGTYGSSGRLDNIMMAAPDIDLDLFREQISQLPENRRDFFVFVSSDDSALRFSRRLSGGVDRVGSADVRELSALGMTVIDLSKVDDSASGSHSKFTGSPEVVQLIGNSLKQDNFRLPPRSPTLIEVLEGVPVLRVLAE
jgi:esterase/lipase superfamily enzyme